MTSPPVEELDRVHALMRDGQADAAVSLLEPLLARCPGCLEAWYTLGEAQGMLERHAQAERAFRGAVRLRPDMHEAHFNVGLSLMYQKKLRESVASFLAARRLDPNISGLDQTLLEVLLQILQDEHHADAGGGVKLPALPRAPLVSVVIPTRDRPGMLRDALESVCAQRYRNWEAVVVNDGGADVSALVQSLRGQSRGSIAPIQLRQAQGQAGARNAGIAATSGDIVAFLDDDDLYKPDHLEALVDALRQSGAAIGYTRAEAVWERIADGERVVLERGPAAPWFRYSRALLLVRNCMPIDNWAVRRECFQACGQFDTTLACAEDWDLLLRFSARFDLQQVAQVTTEVRVRDDAADSVSKRNRLRPVCELLYRRYAAHDHELVELARELYLKSLP